MTTNKLRCPKCGAKLELSTAYSGADWLTQAGKGSGYGWEISLECSKCPWTYHLGNVKNMGDFSPAVNFKEGIKE